MTRNEAIAYGKEQLEIFGGLHKEFIQMAIKSLERKHGEWIEYKCSICGFEPYNPSGLETFNYCSNCGADMRGDND